MLIDKEKLFPRLQEEKIELMKKEESRGSFFAIVERPESESWNRNRLWVRRVALGQNGRV